MLELDGKTPVIQFKISRRLGGISIFVKSKAFEEWIKSIALNPKQRDAFPNSSEYWNITDKQGWNKHKAYKIKKEEDKDPDLACLYSWGANNLFITDHRVPNLAFLKAYGLEHGVVFDLKGLYSEKEILRWQKQAKEQMIRLYQNYVKPYGSSVYILELEEKNI